MPDNRLRRPMTSARGKAFVLFLVLAAFYYLFRVALAAADLTGGLPLDVEPPAHVRNFLDLSELAIGVLGLAGVAGLYRTRRWGYWTTVALSAYTIAFDGWSAVAVQASAAMGIIPPVLIMAYLYASRSMFLHPKEGRG